MAKALAVNEHPVERAVRIVVGGALVALAATGSLGAWGYVGVVPLLTGIVGVCPLYSVFGISTCPVRRGAATR